MSRPHPTRRRLVALVVGLAFALALAACGGSSSKSGSSGGGGGGGAAGKESDVIKLAYNADMQVPDPDIFYEIEGNSVTTSLYEGLVRYAPNSTKIEPALAKTFTKSADGKTYTFTMRTGVKFHDGTALDSAAAKGSFERRTKVNSAPAYMLADVDHYETPNATTFIVKLKKPVSAFLDYLAAPYGPKMVSPKVLKDHAGSDFAQNWLKTHDGGTGPFQMTEFVPGSHYTLARYDGYWGPKAAVAAIDISIIPDISTERLKLEAGDLSMIIHGLSLDDIASFSKNSKFQVQRFPALFKSLLFVNENKGVFKDKAARLALRSAVDRKAIVDQVYGDNGSVSTQFYPAGELPASMAKDVATLDPSKLTDVAKGLKSKKVDLGYSSDDARNQRVAELIQTQLQAAGLDVTTRGIPIAQVFDLPNHPDQAPDLLLATVNPDAAHPDTWARIFSNTKGALNWLQASTPAADTAMDQGLAATDPSAIQTAYGKAGDEIIADGTFLTIADVKEVIVARAGYKHFVHQEPTLFTVRFGDLELGS
ncbi:MAG: ABC transporter substrate-binding protein [Actinomycetota bacterium]|nr:ABC transporter substrate-binding protein [Actinomycetota bacterium]